MLCLGLVIDTTWEMTSGKEVLKVEGQHCLNWTCSEEIGKEDYSAVCGLHKWNLQVIVATTL